MQSFTAVVLGATGLTGKNVVQLLLNDSAFSKVRIVVRRKVNLKHPKLEVKVIDFNNLVQFRDAVGEGDVIFCCIGTTMAQVKGNKQHYRNVDYAIAVNGAAMGKDAGFQKYLLVSSLGANATLSNFYLRLKGEVEKAISNINYPAFHVFRPGIIQGKRKQFRLIEAISMKIMKLIGWMLVGKASKYRSIASADIARAMVAASKSDTTGMVVHHWNDIRMLAKSLE